MIEFYKNGGFFMHPVFLLGILTLVFNILHLKEKEKDYSGVVKWLLIATFFLGILGTTVGFYEAGIYVKQWTTAKIGKSIGIAVITTAFAAFWCTINAILYSMSLRPSRKAKA